MINILLATSTVAAAKPLDSGFDVEGAKLVQYSDTTNFVHQHQLCENPRRANYVLASQIAHHLYQDLGNFAQGAWNDESLLKARRNFNDEVRHIITGRGDAIQGRKLTKAQTTGLRIRELANAKFAEDLITDTGRIGKNIKWRTTCGKNNTAEAGQSTYDSTANMLGEVLPALGICVNALFASGWLLLPAKHLVTRIGEEQVLSKCTWVAERTVDITYPRNKVTTDGEDSQKQLRRTVLAIHLAGKLGDAILSLRFNKTVVSQIFKSDNRTLERVGKFAAQMIDIYEIPLPHGDLIEKVLEVLPYIIKTLVFIFSSDARIGLARFTFSDAFHAIEA